MQEAKWIEEWESDNPDPSLVNIIKALIGRIASLESSVISYNENLVENLQVIDKRLTDLEITVGVISSVQLKESKMPAQTGPYTPRGVASLFKESKMPAQTGPYTPRGVASL